MNSAGWAAAGSDGTYEYSAATLFVFWPETEHAKLLARWPQLTERVVATWDRLVGAWLSALAAGELRPTAHPEGTDWQRDGATAGAALKPCWVRTIAERIERERAEDAAAEPEIWWPKIDRDRSRMRDERPTVRLPTQQRRQAHKAFTEPCLPPMEAHDVARPDGSR